jgi:hypothetical protein
MANGGAKLQLRHLPTISADQSPALSGNNRRVPHIPDFLCSFVGSLNFMRLSLKRAAHAVLSRAAYRKFGASRSFFARCGIPQVFPSSLSRPDRSTRVPHVRTSVRGPKTMGEALRRPFVPDYTICSLVEGLAVLLAWRLASQLIFVCDISSS